MKNNLVVVLVVLSCLLSFGAIKLYQIHQLQVLQAELAAKAYEAERARAESQRAQAEAQRARADELQKRHEKFFAPIELNRNVDTRDTVEDLMNW